MIIILLSLIIGYALYWGISNNDYKMDKKRSIVGEYKLDLKSATPFPKCYLHKEKWTFDS